MPYAAAPLSSQPPQGPAPGSQPSAPAPDWAASLSEHSTPLQFFDGLARHGFGLVSRLLTAVSGMVTRYPRHWRTLLACSTALLRVLLTVRFAPERITMAQLRRLSRARQLIESLLGRPLPFLHPLGARTPSSAAPTISQQPSASPENATPLGPRTSPSAAPTVREVPGIREVPAIPEVPGIPQVSATPTVNGAPLPPALSHSSHLSHTSHISHPSHSSQIPHSASPTAPSDLLPPFIPDLKTMHQALNSATLPPSCAGALLDEPADTLVKALHQLHAVYFSFYPNQPPTSTQSPSPSPSQSPINPQSAIYNPQSAAPSVHPVNNVNPVNPVNPVNNVHSVHPTSSPSPAQSEISNLKSEIPDPDSSSPHSAFHIPHSSAPP